jgi:hypothetical protein
VSLVVVFVVVDFDEELDELDEDLLEEPPSE